MNAEYNHGRWVVACPADDCHSALRVTNRRMVCDCRDEMVCDHQRTPCGARVGVVLPENSGDIERLLAYRPKRSTRNWLPGETMDDLKAENLEHGVRV